MSENCVESIIECESCGEWVEVPSEAKVVECDCGDRYAVTVSKI